MIAMKKLAFLVMMTACAPAFAGTVAAEIKPYTYSQDGKVEACGFHYKATNESGQAIQGLVYDAYMPGKQKGMLTLRITHLRAKFEEAPTDDSNDASQLERQYSYVPLHGWLKVRGMDDVAMVTTHHEQSAPFLEKDYFYKPGDTLSPATLIFSMQSGLMIGSDTPLNHETDTVYYISPKAFAADTIEEITGCIYALHPEMRHQPAPNKPAAHSQDT